MYCNHCGSPLKDHANFCTKCGNKVSGNVSWPEKAESPKVSAPENGTFDFKILVKGLLVVCLIFFFLPFVTVSCGNMEMSATGAELATGAIDRSYTDGQDVAPNIFLAAAMIITIISLVLAFIKKEEGNLISVLSVVSAVCMVLFVATFKAYYDLDEDEIAGMLKVEYHFGIWALVIFNFVTAFLARKKPEPIVLTTSVTPEEIRVAPVEGTMSVQEEFADKAEDAPDLPSLPTEEQ